METLNDQYEQIESLKVEVDSIKNIKSMDGVSAETKKLLAKF